MPNAYGALSPQDKLAILRCDDVSQFQALFDNATELLEESPLHPRYKKRRASLNEAILALMVQEPSLPAVMMWGIVGSITLAFPSLAILAIASLALLVLGAGVYGPMTYLEVRKEREESNTFFKFAMLRLNCANDVKLYYNNEIIKHCVKRPIPYFETPRHIQSVTWQYKNDQRTAHIKRSIGLGLLTSTGLFGTYYIGTCAVFAAFALTAAFGFLAGPIAIGVGGAIALGIGAYFAYRQYKNLKHADKVKQLSNVIETEIKAHRWKCDQLINTVSHINLNEPPLEVPPKKQRAFLPRAQSVDALFPLKQKAMKPNKYSDSSPRLQCK